MSAQIPKEISAKLINVAQYKLSKVQTKPTAQVKVEIIKLKLLLIKCKTNK